MEKILTTHNLSKRYKNLQVLRGISLEVEEGSVFGLLGPNGSGKTTTLGIILDIIPQNEGSYSWFGQVPSHRLRKQIGSLLETPNFFGYLSGERNLKITANIKGVPYSDIDRVLKIVNLHSRKKHQFKTYSLGMKQRLAIAAALLGQPKVLLLDEPTNGLDPQGIAEIRELILRIAKEGITIILASHMLDEVEKVCSHVAIIKKGSLIIQGKVDEILGNEYLVELKAEDMTKLKAVLKDYPPVKEIKSELETYIVKFSENISNAQINEYCFKQGIALSHMVSKKKKLETQFLEITN